MEQAFKKYIDGMDFASSSYVYNNGLNAECHSHAPWSP